LLPDLLLSSRIGCEAHTKIMDQERTTEHECFCWGNRVVGTSYEICHLP
jgi:hypothetical protein